MTLVSGCSFVLLSTWAGGWRTGVELCPAAPRGWAQLCCKVNSCTQLCPSQQPEPPQPDVDEGPVPITSQGRFKVIQHVWAWDEQFPAQLTPGEGVPDGRLSVQGRGGLATSQCQGSAAPEAERSSWVTFRLFPTICTHLVLGVLTTQTRNVHLHVMVYWHL